MRVLITGASGFIGSQLARLLVQEGCEVFALLRPESDPWRIKHLLPALQVVPGDLLNLDGWTDALKDLQPQICFHFAWYAQPGVFLHSPRNLQYLSSSLALAERLADSGCRKLVVAGSFSEYDQARGYLSERSPIQPTTLYGACKAALHQALRLWAPAAGLDLLWARIFSVYGPGEHPQRFVPAVILAALRGEPTRLSPGEQMRDYLHVEDVAAAVWAAANSDLAGPINIASGKPVPIGEIARRIGQILGRPELIRLGDLPYRAGDPMFVCADTALLKEATAWVPQYDLERGLINTIDWWQEHLDDD